jgi:hypothetical protein
MENLPEKTCSIDKLVTQPMMISSVKSGNKTQQRRNGVYGYPGETFELDGMTFVITDLKRERLGDMTDEHAKAEGFPSLEFYQDIILKMHAGMTWNPDSPVWTHSFALKTD